MIILLKTAAALMFALIALPASAAGCQDAVSLIDRTVCNTPDLNKLDADLNRLYSDLRTRLTAAQRSALLTQQRAWLVVRNRECATAAAECLHAQYAVRVDQLEALHASYTAAEGKLDDLTPVMVTGSWNVNSIKDPAGAGNPAKMDVQSSLDLADLPAVGAVVKTQPGKICLPAQACGAMGWYRKRLAEVNSSNAIARYLKLDKTTEVLVGSSGAKESYYLLVPQRDGSGVGGLHFLQHGWKHLPPSCRDLDAARPGFVDLTSAVVPTASPAYFVQQHLCLGRQRHRAFRIAAFKRFLRIRLEVPHPGNLVLLLLFNSS